MVTDFYHAILMGDLTSIMAAVTAAYIAVKDLIIAIRKFKRK